MIKIICRAILITIMAVGVPLLSVLDKIGIKFKFLDKYQFLGAFVAAAMCGIITIAVIVGVICLIF